jgi:L,D-transpeptidase catalytic domain
MMNRLNAYPPRTRRSSRRILLPGMIAALLLAATAHGAAQDIQQLASLQAVTNRPLHDTIFVLDSAFIEIDLSRQELYRHSRGGLVDTFLCSSGNPKIPRGIATRTGIFSIAWKARKHWSSRFGVPMFYWMPFDGGIGIHALKGDDYYPFLGFEPSSHGCVRVSNETGESLYDNTPVGTVVFVHSGSPARIVRFAEPGQSDITVMKSVDSKLLRARLNAVMTGRADDPSLAARLALPAGSKPKLGIRVGG